MTILFRRRAVLVAAVVLLGAAVPAMAAPADGVALAPHRAVYDLKLLKSHGSRGVAAVRGRILYDFSGNACEGYDLKFRQVSELDSGEGKTVLSDLNSTTWEDAKARSFRFNSQNRMNESAANAVNGEAERRTQAVAVNLDIEPAEKPEQVLWVDPTHPTGAV